MAQIDSEGLTEEAIYQRGVQLALNGMSETGSFNLSIIVEGEGYVDLFIDAEEAVRLVTSLTYPMQGVITGKGWDSEIEALITQGSREDELEQLTS